MTPEAGATLVGVVVTLGIALVGWAKAHGADQHAAEAIRLAQSAENRADRLERVQIERRDVKWVHRVVKKGDVLSFENAGSDAACNVELVVDSTDGEFPRKHQEFGDIPAAGRIGMHLTSEVRAKEQQQVADAAANIWGPVNTAVRVRITWRSPLGVPGIQEFERIIV